MRPNSTINSLEEVVCAEAGEPRLANYILVATATRTESPLQTGQDDLGVIHTTNAAVDQLVKSRERVKTYGEVFTPSPMVNQMLDLVGEELENGPDFVDKTFFEPAAGDGNFLVAILRRKLHAIERRCSAADIPMESLHAIASIYGVELLEDNHREAKAILLSEFLNFHRSRDITCLPDTHLYRSANFLIDTNIVVGNTLTARTSGGKDIEFSWWNRIANSPGMVEREPFTLASLRDGGFDFTTYCKYKPSLISRVHEETKADA